MSERVERAFLSTLQAVERQLPSPVSKRIDLLRELEADLEALSSGLESQGVPLEEARQRAVEALVPDPGVLRELARLHRPAYVRFTQGLERERLRILERSALGLTTAATVLAGAVGLSQADLLRDPSPFLVPVLALGAVLVGLVLMKGFQLWVKADHRQPDVGVRAILLLSGTILMTAFLGLFLDLFQLTRRLEAAPQLSSELVTRWIVQDAGLLSVALTLALLGGLSWFVLNHWQTLIWSRHRELLELPRAPANKPTP
ncbi:MAG: hypothetical protein ACR2QM_02150 [Longimicrobiales bacterium]